MSRHNSCRNYRGSDMRDDPIALSGRNSRSGRDGLSDYMSGERFGNFVPPSGSSRHVHSRGSYGGEYGWSREGRVRQQPSLFLRDPEAPPPRFLEDRSDRKLNTQALMAQYNMDPDQTAQPDHSGLGAVPYYRRETHPSAPQYDQNTFIDYDDTCSQGPHFEGAQGLLDFGTGSSWSSLGLVSDYFPDHFVRLGRPYHYRPPYVENDPSSEPRDDQDDRGSLHSMMSPTSFSGLFSPRRGLLTDAGNTPGSP